mgnify:CR=1 FL=1
MPGSMEALAEHETQSRHRYENDSDEDPHTFDSVEGRDAMRKFRVVRYVKYFFYSS